MILLGRAAALLGVVGVLGLALLPPEHVHLGAEDVHDGPASVHRHFEPHHQVASTTHVEHPEDEAHYLASVADVPTQASIPGPDDDPDHDAVVSALEGPVAFVSRVPLGPDARVHDPPWVESLASRGPPASV